MDKIPLVVGNETGGALTTITLAEYLEHLRQYLHNPRGWTGSESSLLIPERDSHVIMSAQACFLPVPKVSPPPRFKLFFLILNLDFFFW